MRALSFRQVVKAAALVTGLTLSAFNVAMAGTGSSGGGGQYSKLCAAKALSVLALVGDTTALSEQELRSTLTNNVKWEVKPALIDNETHDIVAARISNNGEKYTDATTAFYGSPGHIQINSNANLKMYCSLETHENDEIILHELLRAARYNDEVFQISLVAMRAKSMSAAPINKGPDAKNTSPQDCNIYGNWTGGRLAPFDPNRELIISELVKKGFKFVNEKQQASFEVKGDYGVTCNHQEAYEKCQQARAWVHLIDLKANRGVQINGYSEAHLFRDVNLNEAFKKMLASIPYCKIN